MTLFTGLAPKPEDNDPILHKSIHQYDDATHSSTDYSGTILLDGVEVAQTRQCCHCNSHFIKTKQIRVGPEKCWYCGGYMCLKKVCNEGCLPFEQWLENVERALPPGHRPIVAAVSGDVPVPILKGVAG